MSERARSVDDVRRADHSLSLAASLAITHPRRIGWVVAAAIGLGVSVVLALTLLYIPHWMLTKLPALSRGVRVTLATSWIAGATMALLWCGIRFGRADAPVD
jgi:hypothetical protein